MDDPRRFWVGFSLASGIGAARLRQLTEAFGDVEAAWNAPSEQLYGVGLPRAVVDELVRTRQQVDLDLELARVEEGGFHVLTWDDPDYPDRLRELDAPPPVIYVWGELIPDDRFAVAIVGTRRMTTYGRTVAQELAQVLGENGITVVSGLARGVDGIAHRGALQGGGRTIAVLGSGVDHIYPPEHRRLADEIAENGAVISEYALGVRPEGRNFPPRNRIISGLSLVVVVVEAGEASGALITANFAAEQGRDVFAVPGSIHSPASRGCHKLMRTGAQIMLSPQDVIEALNLDLVVRQEAMQLQLPEDDVQRAVYQELGQDPIHVDDLGERCGLPISAVTSALAMLELKGRARQAGGMTYVVARESSPEYRVE